MQQMYGTVHSDRMTDWKSVRTVYRDGNEIYRIRKECEKMAAKHGNLSINSDNIFPIIKKWLYSDHDIFFRELISNGCDAITKLKKLDMMGEYALPDGYKPQIQVIVNPEEKTLKFIDNGIGMTADEVEEYINQIAFSGATDFIEKYKDKANEDQICGHFGLGVYGGGRGAYRLSVLAGRRAAGTLGV